MEDAQEFHLIGAGVVRNQGVDCLAIGVFKRANSNYAYIAEVDINFNILRFRETSCRGLSVLPVSTEKSFRTGDQCPVLISYCVGRICILDTPISDHKISNILNDEPSALLAAQVVQIANVSLSKSVSQFERFAKQMDLKSSVERDFISSMISGLQYKDHNWKSVDAGEGEYQEKSEEYKTWSDDVIANWLSSHYEIDDSIWYRMWTYFDEFRKIDDDVLLSGVKYLLNWSSEEDHLLPVGMVISRLLSSTVGHRKKDEIASAIEIGFLKGKFFYRSSHVSPQRRLEFFDTLKDHLSSSNVGRYLYPEFIIDMFISNSPIFNCDEKTRDDMGIFITRNELIKYSEEFISALDNIRYIPNGAIATVSATYFASKDWRSPHLRKRLANSVKTYGRIPADVMRAYSTGVEEGYWR